MNLTIFNTEANNIWKQAASRSASDQLRFELDLYKKLLSFFQVGDYCYYIFNIAILDLEFVSKETEMLLGYHPSEFNMRMLLDIIHPDDRPYFLNFENTGSKFLAMLPLVTLMKYKIRYDYRVKKKDGEFIRILQQSVVIEHDDNGRIARTFATHTDITHLKSEGKPMLSFIGLDGEPSYINVDVEKVFSISNEFLSKREKQVLSLLIDGKLSKEIGDILHISKQTVDKHRKNMITRNNLSNTGELIAKAIKQGWL
jgi:DNA-binding CsgD family transcriptional regulator